MAKTKKLSTLADEERYVAAKRELAEAEEAHRLAHAEWTAASASSCASLASLSSSAYSFYSEIEEYNDEASWLRAALDEVRRLLEQGDTLDRSALARFSGVMVRHSCSHVP